MHSLHDGISPRRHARPASVGRAPWAPGWPTLGSKVTAYINNVQTAALALISDYGAIIHHINSENN